MLTKPPSLSVPFLVSTTAVLTASTQGRVTNLLEDGSFESMAPGPHTWSRKRDGGSGWWEVVSSTDAPHGRKVLRMTRWAGNHAQHSPTFTAASETLTVSVSVRDNGLTNSWPKRLPHGRATFALGLLDVQADSETRVIEGAVPDYKQWTRLVRQTTAVPGREYKLLFCFNPRLGNQLLDLDAFQVEQAATDGAFAGREYVYRFVEAEDLTSKPESGWRPVDGTGADIYRPVSRNRVMLGGKTDKPASATLAIPAVGEYIVWVRLLKQNRLHAPFRVVVKQAGETVADEWLHCTNRTGDRDGGHWYWRWERTQGRIGLRPGHATISLVPGAGPADMPKTGRGGRDLDCLLLTSDPYYEPAFGDFAPPVFVRVAVSPTPSKPYTLTVHVMRRKGKIYERPGRVSRGGLLRSIAGEIPPGQPSEWVELTQFLQEWPNKVWMTVALEGGEKPTRVKARIDIARAPGNTPFRTLEEDLAGNVISAMIPGNLEKYADQILDPESIVARHESFVAGLDYPESRRAKLLSLETYFIGWGDAYRDPGLLDRELTVLKKLGFNSLLGARIEAETAGRFGFDRLRLMHFLRRTYRPRAELAGYFDGLFAKAAKNWAETVGGTPHFVKLGDEYGSFFGRLPKSDAALADFRSWLRDQQFAPADFDQQSWDQIKFVERKDAMSVAEKRLHYSYCRFAHLYDAIFYREATRAVERHFGDPKPRTMMNYSPSILGDGSWSPTRPDWLTIAREGGTSINWSEDWQSWKGWYAGEQLMSLICDVLRSGSRTHGQPVGCYAIYNTDPAHFERKVCSAIAHGAKIVCYYTYGPAPYTPEVSFSENPDALRRIARLNHDLGAADDLLGPGQVRPAETAMLISHPSGCWRTTDGFAADLRGTYLALLHSHVPVEFLEEADIEAGALSDYRLLYVSAPNLTRRAAELIRAWVADGGTIVVSAGSGVKDELDEPMAELKRVFGLDDWKMIKTDPVGRDKIELPLRKSLDTVTMADREPYNGLTFNVVGWKQQLTPAAAAAVVGLFSDGTPAAVVNRFGKGQSLYFGALPGTAYLWSAQPNRKEPTTGYQEHPRRVCELGTKLAGITKPMETSHPLVEATVLESAGGVVIPLINWSEQHLREVTVRLRSTRPFSSTRAVQAGELRTRQNGDTLEMSLPLKETDLIQLRR